MKNSHTSAKRFIFGLIAGVTLGVVLSSFGLTRLSIVRADNISSPVWILNGIYGAGCSDWQHDTGYFPGTTTQFLEYWSGQPAYWNDSAANACWHNDEGLSSWWRAIDYPSAAGTYIEYKGYIGGANLAEGQHFTAASGCPGVAADIYTPNGNFAGSMHYWHMTAASGVIGTYWANHYYGQTTSNSQRTIGTVLAHADDTCTNTGDHMHQAIFQSGWAQPNKEGAVTWSPDTFGW